MVHRDNIFLESKTDVAAFFAELAPHLPEELKDEALAAACAVRHNRNRAESLAALAPLLPEDLKTDLLASAGEIEYGQSRVKVLSALAPYLPDRLKREALALARAFGSEALRADALAAIGPHMPDILKAEVLADSDAIAFEPSRFKVIYSLLPGMPDHLRAKALAAARSLKDHRNRAKVLLALAPYLTDQQRNKAGREIFAAVQAANDKRLWPAMFDELIAEQADDLKTEAFVAALSIENETDRLDVLIALAPKLSNALKTKAFRAVLSFSKEENLGNGLVALIPLLSEDLSAEVLTAARGISNGYHRAKVLSAIATHLAEDSRYKAYKDALSAAREIDSEALRVEVLSSLAIQLPDPFMGQALAVARSLCRPENRAEALARLAPGLPEDLRDEALREAFSAARSIGYDDTDNLLSLIGYKRKRRVEALSVLAPRLPLHLLAEALRDAFAAARFLDNHRGDFRWEALVAFVPYLPADMMAEALMLARALKNNLGRAEVLLSMAPHIQENLSDQAYRDAVAAARRIEKPENRGPILARAARHLPPGLEAQIYSEALDSVRSIENPMNRARALIHLAPSLPGKLRRECLRHAIQAAPAIEEKWVELEAMRAALEHDLKRRGAVTQSAFFGFSNFIPNPPGDQQRAEIRCHLHAEMPTCASVLSAVELKVTLSLSRLKQRLGPTVKADTMELRSGQEILVIIRPRFNCRVIGPDREIVPAPTSDRPEELIFEVQGERHGTGELFVEARQGARRLLTLVLQPQFTAEVVPSRTTATAVTDFKGDEPPLVEVRILEESLGGDRFRLHFLVQCRELGLNLSQRSEPVHRTRERFVEGLYKRLEDFWSRDGSEYPRFYARLRALGAEFYVQLVPERIRRELWKHRNALGCIQVISEEPFIPWEIAHLVDPDQRPAPDRTWFLGELGLVRWLDNLQWPPAKLTLRPGGARYVIPDYPDSKLTLAGARHEKDLMVQLFGAQPAPADSLALVNLLQQAGGIDLLHFACHGFADNAEIWNAGLMLEGRMDRGNYLPDPLEVSQVNQYAALRHSDGTQPMVFLNACQVGRRGYTLTGTGGFADAFLRNGAGLFVGTLWSVGDSPAVCFAQTFYDRFKAGDTLTAASRAGRAAAMDNKEATWLAYTVYGHPYARLVSKQRHGVSNLEL